MTAKTIWFSVGVLAVLPYIALMVFYPYVRIGGFSAAFSFLMLFLPPALIFGVILSFLLDRGEGRYNPRVLIRVLFAANLVFYGVLFYSIFINV